MAHTMPPWTSRYKMTTVFGHIELSELAARLGSPNIFDRHGHMVFMDDFESGTLFWGTGGNGTGSSVDLVGDWAKTGSQSVKLTAGEGADGSANIVRYFGIKIIGKIGAEFSFTLDAETAYVELNIRYYNGTYLYSFDTRYDLANTKIQGYNGAASWSDIETGVILEAANDTFHTMKLVVDIQNLTLSKIYLDDFEEDISSFTPVISGSALAPCIRVCITHKSANAAVKHIWVDDFILTVDEP